MDSYDSSDTDFSEDDDSIISSEDEDEDVFGVLQEGDVKERKETLSQLDTKTIKTLLNVIMNVIVNPNLEDRILPHHKKQLKHYKSILKKLTDKKMKIEKKRKLLQRTGHAYLPIFLEIIDSDLDDCKPVSRKINRKARDCPLCDAIDLKRLPQHLSHNI